MDDLKLSAQRENRLFDSIWLLVFGFLASLYCVVAAQKLGATFDEPFYVSAGMERWRTGSYDKLLRLGTMPLPVDVQTLPLYLYETWHGIRFDTLADLEVLLPWARLGTLVFFWLLLIYGRLIGRALAGPWGGRLAVAFLALEPSFLGHASLATTDICVTACLLPLVYHYWKNREAARWIWRIGLPSFCFAVALLAKASSLVFGPLCLLVIECQRLYQKGAFHLEGSPGIWARLGQARNALKPWFRQMWAIGLLGVGLTFVYCGADWRAEPTFIAWAQTLPEGMFREVMLGLANSLQCFPNAGSGLVRQVRHNLQGHVVYLVGMEARRSLWFYFPLLLTIKLTLPLLILTALLLLVRPRALANWPFLCFLVLLAFSLTFRVQIGIRMVLPMVSLGMIGLAAGLVRAAQESSFSWRRRALGAATLAGLAWTGAATARQCPHGLCYANEIWGGTREAYLFVSDANYDWGQGLKELRRWQERHQVKRLDVWYFGTDPLLNRLPVEQAAFNVEAAVTEEAFLARMRGRYLAVGTTLLYGGYVPPDMMPVPLLRRLQPAARTQTFLIYDFRTPETLARQEPIE